MKICAGMTISKKDYPAALVYCSPSIYAYRSAIAISGKVVYNSYASPPNLKMNYVFYYARARKSK